MPDHPAQTSVLLPRDKDSQSVQTLSLDASKTLAIAIATGNVALPAGTEIIRVANKVDMYMRFGTSSVVATTTDDALVPAGVEIFRLPTNVTHVAVISSDGATTGESSFTKLL